jgi:predicted protein tyrosine phosphatase
MAFVLSQLGHNSRAAGSSPDFALIPVDEVLIEWADQIVFVNKENHDALKHRFDLKRVDCLILDIPDKYKYRDPELMKICEEQYTKANNNE